MGPFKTIQFTGPATSGSYITLHWTGSGGSVVSATEYFNPTRSASYQAAIGTDGVTQATNYANALSIDFAGNFTVTASGEFVYVASINTTSSISGSTNNPSTLFDTTASATVTSVDGLLVRSPYIFITTGSNFDTTTYTIKTWEGHLTGSDLEPVSFYKTKQKIVNTQQNIWIDPTHLVREGFEANMTSYYLNTTDYTSSFSIGSGESKWIRVDTSRYITGSFIDSGSKYFYALDGYLEPGETQHIPDILLSGNERVISDVFPGKFHFKNDTMISMSYVSNLSNTPVSISLSTSSFNTDYVKSVNVFNSPGVEWVTYNWVSNTNSGSVTFTYQETCKHEPYVLVFKNKYGVLEPLNVSKKNSRSISRNSSDYLRSIVNYEGEVNTARHTNKQFNVSGVEEFVLNTDYLPQYMNSPIQELILSEEIWLLDLVNGPRPVILTDSNLNYKTILNDKLIQYTFRVKLSHSTVNNIQ